MYQFYMNDYEGWFVQVYNDGDITEEYARSKIDELTEGRSDEFVPVCMSLNLFDFNQIILPFSVPDDTMKCWSFPHQLLQHTRTYKEDAVEPYFPVDVKYGQDKVQMIGL